MIDDQVKQFWDNKIDEEAERLSWIVKTHQSPVFECPCGLKFIKTRGEDQSLCLFCMGIADRRNLKLKK